MAMSAVIGAVLPQPLAWSSSSESGHPLGDHGPWHLRAGGGAVHSIRSGRVSASRLPVLISAERSASESAKGPALLTCRSICRSSSKWSSNSGPPN